MAFWAVGRMLSLDLARESEVRLEGQQSLLCLWPTQGSQEKVVGGQSATSAKLYSTVASAEDGGESP